MSKLKKKTKRKEKKINQMNKKFKCEKKKKILTILNN